MHSDPVCTPVTLKTDKRFFPPARCVLGQPCNHVHTAGPDLRPGDDEAGGPARLRRVLGHLRPGQRAVPEPPARDAGRGGRPALAPLRRHRDRPAGAGQAGRQPARCWQSLLLGCPTGWCRCCGGGGCWCWRCCRTRLVGWPRQDFVGLVNPRDDDGVTAYISPANGVGPAAKPYRSTTVSWWDFMDSASEIVHDGAGRAITINDHMYRVDMMRHVDHAADEHGGSYDRIHAGAADSDHSSVPAFRRSGAGVGPLCGRRRLHSDRLLACFLACRPSVLCRTL